MSADKLTDEQRRARALAIDQIHEKIKAEYGDALVTLGMLPVVARVWPYTVEEHVESARRHGVELDTSRQRIQREYLDLLRSASLGELGMIVIVLTKLLEFDRIPGTRYDQLVNEIINVLTCAEGHMEIRERREAKRDDHSSP